MGKKSFLPVRTDDVYTKTTIEQFDLESEPLTKMGATFHPTIIPIIEEILTKSLSRKRTCWNITSILLFSGLILSGTVISSKYIGDNQVGYYNDESDIFFTKGLYAQFPWSKQMIVENMGSIYLTSPPIRLRLNVSDLTSYVRSLKEHDGYSNLLQSIKYDLENYNYTEFKNILQSYGLNIKKISPIPAQNTSHQSEQGQTPAPEQTTTTTAPAPEQTTTTTAPEQTTTTTAPEQTTTTTTTAPEQTTTTTATHAPTTTPQTINLLYEEDGDANGEENVTDNSYLLGDHDEGSGE